MTVHHMTRRSLLGATFALTAAVLFGLAIPAAKVLLGDLEAVLLTGLLYAGAAIGLGVLAVVLRRFAVLQSEPIRGAQWRWLGLSVLVGGLAAPLLLLMGLDWTPASTASLLMNIESPLTAVFAAMVFGEHVGRRLILGITAITVGAAVVSWQGSPDGSGLLGPLVVIASSIAWALDNNIVRRVSNADPVQIAAIRSAFAAVVYLTYSLVVGYEFPSAGVAALCMLLGLFGFGFALVLFVLSLRTLGAARAAAFFATGPFIGAIGAVAVLGEPLTAALLVAAVLMAAGVWLVLGGAAHDRH